MSDLQICHAAASATGVNQGVELWVLQQPLASTATSASNFNYAVFASVVTPLDMQIAEPLLRSERPFSPESWNAVNHVHR